MAYFKIIPEALAFKIIEKIKNFKALKIILRIFYKSNSNVDNYHLYYKYTLPIVYINLVKAKKTRLVKKFKWAVCHHILSLPQQIGPCLPPDDINRFNDIDAITRDNEITDNQIVVYYLSGNPSISGEISRFEVMLDNLPLKTISDIGVETYKQCYGILKLLELLVTICDIEPNIYVDIVLRCMEIITYSPNTAKVNAVCRNIMIRLIEKKEFIRFHKSIIKKIYRDDDIHPEFYQKYVEKWLNVNDNIPYKVVALIIQDFVCRRKTNEGVHIPSKILKEML